MENHFITRSTFYGENPIQIPIYNTEKDLIIDIECKSQIPLQCAIRYRKNMIYKIVWRGFHQKPDETFSYKTKDGRIFIYVQKCYSRGLGTTTDKELEIVI